MQRDSEWRVADLSIRKVAALQALARWGRKISDGDIASIAIEPNLWPTSAVIDWFDLLKRAPGLSGRDEQMAQAEQILRSRLNFQGTTMGFSTERTDYLWWLMVSGDVNANRVVLSMLDQDKWGEDMPRLVRGSLGRQQAGRWNTTVANAWGVLAMGQFAARVRNRSRDRCHPRPTGQAGAQARLEQAGGGRQPDVLLAGRGSELEPAAGWHRQAMGHDPKPRCDPAQGAVLVRLSDQAHGVGGGTEGQLDSGRAAT